MLDLLLARRQFQNGMVELLAGLKSYVETGQPVDSPLPKGASPAP